MADDLATATWVIGDAVETLRRSLAQLAAGDPNGRELVQQELDNAKYFRGYYRDVADVDFTELDRVISQAKRAVSSVTLDKSGLRIGTVRIPWIGIAGGVVILGAAIAVAFRVRKGRRRGRATA